MSVTVLLNLLIQLRKIDKMRGLPHKCLVHMCFEKSNYDKKYLH